MSKFNEDGARVLFQLTVKGWETKGIKSSTGNSNEIVDFFFFCNKFIQIIERVF